MILTREVHVYIYNVCFMYVRMQVGCVDSIVDIVTASVLVDALGPEDVRHGTHILTERERERERER